MNDPNGYLENQLAIMQQTIYEQQQRLNKLDTQTNNNRDNLKNNVEYIKIYKEMQEEARNSIVDSGTLSDNLLEARWIVFRNPYPMELAVIVTYKLNGKPYRIDFKCADDLSRTQQRDLILEKLRDHMVGHILQLAIEEKTDKTGEGMSGFKMLRGDHF